MKFGIRFIGYVGSMREIIDYSVLAEEAGFEFVWYPHDTFMQNTWVTTSAVAERTSKIKIGSVGTNPYTTSPAEIATYIATLDEISNGRAVLGLGLHTEKMVEWTGINAANYMTATREATEIIRALLKGEIVEYQGEQFNWSEQCYLRFTPLRDAVPIYICPFGEDYLKLSGEIGDGSLPMITPPASASYMVPPIREGAEQVGREPDDVDIAGCAWLSISSDRTAASEVLRRMAAYFGPYLESPALQSIGLGTEDFSEIKTHLEAKQYNEAERCVTEQMFKLALSGTPEDVITQIEKLESDGITQVNLGGPLGPDVKEAIRLMGDKVIPYFN